MQMLQHRRRHFKQKPTNQVPRTRHTTLQHFQSQIMLLSQVVRLRQGWTHRNTSLARVRCPRAQKKIITKARVTEGNI